MILIFYLYYVKNLYNYYRTQIAICPNNNEIHIYQTTGESWNRLFVLTEHDLLVSAIGILYNLLL